MWEKEKEGREGVCRADQEEPSRLREFLHGAGTPAHVLQKCLGVWRQVKARMVKTGESRVDEEKKSM